MAPVVVGGPGWDLGPVEVTRWVFETESGPRSFGFGFSSGCLHMQIRFVNFKIQISTVLLKLWWLPCTVQDTMYIQIVMDMLVVPTIA